MGTRNIDIDIYMTNKMLNSKKIDSDNFLLSFFWKGYYVSCYWSPSQKQISLLNSRYEFSDEELKKLTENFTNVQWDIE